MAGTKAGGQKAALKNRELYGKDFYARIGGIGGKKGTTGGFAANRDLAREAGRKGGLKSRRTAKVDSTAIAHIDTQFDEIVKTQDDVQLAA